ncbi:MAG: acyltransferase [Stenomitos rutilans HA7619-LM2]|jgi:peptidoglycan/LPS O-acetylase OafA/YrhL|nr:acyltransferase [Stenomitos rutilans HA7619-LM2]
MEHYGKISTDRKKYFTEPAHIMGLAMANVEGEGLKPGANPPLPPKIRLEFLDGMRGLTAFYVVLVHVYREIDAGLQGDGLPVLFYWATRWMTHGRNAVSIFIVLSGFCLMLPVVRSATGQLRGGVLQYLKRRAWRIIPPYYMTLILLVLLFLVIPRPLQSLMGVAWNESMPALTEGTILSHVLLIQNLSLSWIYKMEIPMWSVATEWQIYFVFPLLLLVWRRLNLATAVGLAFAIGLALHFLPHSPLDQAIPWFLGLFALGMYGAHIVFSPKRTAIALRKRFPWRSLAWMSLTGLAAEYFLRPSIDANFSTVFISDLLVGLFALSVIVDCATHRAEKRDDRLAILAVLESKWVVWLGKFSYSLYLIHLPILGLAELPLSGLHSPVSKFFGLLLLGVPMALLASYGFHLLFEKPFMSEFSRSSRQKAIET